MTAAQRDAFSGRSHYGPTPAPYAPHSLPHRAQTLRASAYEAWRHGHLTKPEIQAVINLIGICQQIEGLAHVRRDALTGVAAADARYLLAHGFATGMNPEVERLHSAVADLLSDAVTEPPR